MAYLETNILRKWLIKYARFATLFRTQVGSFWAGTPVKKWSTFGTDGKETKWVTLQSAQYISIGVKGLADYTGWRTITVTQEMVGHRVAVYTAVEGKTEDGRISDDQKRFILAVRRAGGIAMVVRSEDTKPTDWEPQ